jgi:hypothetical protein
MESTRLRLSKYSLAYRARLADGWNHLGKFLIQEGSSWKSFLKGTPNEIDECLEKYVIACHNKNKKGLLWIHGGAKSSQIPHVP